MMGANGLTTLQVQENDNDQSRLLHELCALVSTILHSSSSGNNVFNSLQRAVPAPAGGTSTASASEGEITEGGVTSRSVRGAITYGREEKMSPAGLASLLLGVSMALMFCGSVTFMIGFLLMPWVIAFVMVLYFVGVVANLTWLTRAVFFPRTLVATQAYVSSTRTKKDLSEEGFRSTVFGIFPIMPF